MTKLAYGLARLRPVTGSPRTGRVTMVVLLALVPVLSCLPRAAAGVSPSERMAAPRAAHTATALPSGDALIVGGCARFGCESDERSASTELYDHVRKTFSPGPRLSGKRVSHTATLLADGSVLIAGGYSGERRPPTSTAEIYEPDRRAFTPVGSMTSPRGGSTATRLRDGTVLVAGGDSGTRTLESAEVFDPKTRRFTATGSMTTARSAHAATLLRDGRVLVVGGANAAGDPLASAEVYDPRTKRFARVGRLRVARHKLAAATLRDGTVLVIGGSGAGDFSGRYATAEIFDPRRGRSLRLVRMAEPRFKLRDAVVRLPSGRVLVAGGGRTVEIYDPKARRFRKVGRVGTPLSFATATVLGDGRVLIAGGYDDRIAVTSRVWVYRG